MPAKKKAGLWKSQLGRVKHFGRTLAEGLGGKLFQFGISATLRENALPLAVTGLVLEETGEVHHLAGFFLGQSIHYGHQFLGCRTHA